MSYQAHFEKAKSLRKNLTEAEVEAELRKAFGMRQQAPAKKSSPATPSFQKKAKRKKADFPLYPVICLTALFLGASSYMLVPEYFDELIERVDVQFMGHASASADESGKKAPAAKVGKEEKAAAPAGTEVNPHAENSAAPTAEDLSYLSKLRDRQAALDLRETELNQLEEELQRQRTEVEKRIAELTKIREEIAAKLEDRVAADEGKVKKLVELYSSMKPKQAAKIIETVNTDLAVEVLANMKKKSAADIMNVMDEKVAKELSERLTGYKRAPSSTK